MLADRMGHQPLTLRHHSSAARGQSDFSAVGRAYLLLIDRENPLSSLSRRR
jgi:hypothetical protein